MGWQFGYECMECGHAEGLDTANAWCPVCGGLWTIKRDGERCAWNVDVAAVGLWRYRAMLPLSPQVVPVTLGEGWTPLTWEQVPVGTCYFKHEYLMPTGSFKDRGASVLVTLSRHMRVRSVVADSSGNAGAAVAAYCARAGLPCRIFVPECTSPVKTRQMEMVGADVERIPGRRENAALAVMEAAGGAFYASHYRHPLFFHGVKTITFEIWEQMGRAVPGTVILPVGNGSLVLGVYTGFRELVAMGLVQRMPVLIGVQAARCAPLVHRMHGGVPVDVTALTVAEGIAIAEPVQGDRIIEAVRSTGGTLIEVEEAEIIGAYGWAWRRGICIEKTAAVGIAGVNRIGQMPGYPEPYLTVLTGNGLKMLASDPGE
ncbi:pyridoxal-phosphate dependent enzyme [bacterium]|nr:pyridoxal-phosphate dependent enzyme [candidate division CSSED10-310 bacterium]